MKISQLCMVELWFERFEYYQYIQMWQYMLICGVGAKPVTHLMQYHLLQWEVAKVKPLISGVITSGNISDSPVMKKMDDNRGLMIIGDASHKHIQPLTLAYFRRDFIKYGETFI